MMKLKITEKGASMPMFALMIPVIMLIMAAAINYQFYSSGESRLDAGTDRAVDTLAVNYTIEEFEDRTLLSLIDHLDGSTLDTLTEVSIYRASPDAIPGVPNSGEQPLECTQECIRFELNPDTNSFDLVMDAWPINLQHSCDEVLVGVTAVIDHDNITPLEFFNGPITSSKIARTQADDTCIPEPAKRTVLNAQYDSSQGFGAITEIPRTIPWKEVEDNRNISIGSGNFLILEDGSYNISTSVLIDANPSSALECNASMPFGDIGSGILGPDPDTSPPLPASGTGYILYSVEDVTTRFGINVDNSDHLTTVFHDGTSWMYYNGNTLASPFDPQPGDCLLAEIDYVADSVIQTFNTQHSVINGIPTGYSGTITIQPNFYNGATNNGEWTVTSSGAIQGIPAPPASTGSIVGDITLEISQDGNSIGSVTEPYNGNNSLFVQVDEQLLLANQTIKVLISFEPDPTHSGTLGISNLEPQTTIFISQLTQE